VVSGADLRVADPAITTRLSEWRLLEIERGNLRCPCGGLVVPLAPIYDT